MGDGTSQGTSNAAPARYGRVRQQFLDPLYFLGIAADEDDGDRPGGFRLAKGEREIATL